MRAAALALALTLASAASAAAAVDERLSLTGYVRGYAAAQVKTPNAYAIVQNTAETELSYSGERAKLKVSPYLYQYSSARELGVRQAYVDLSFDRFDLRVGKQQVIWGKADGVFITDIVSPKDLSEFLLRDFAEIRQGVTALKADYYIGDNTLELVLLPVFTPTRLPEPGSPWRPTTTTFPVQPTFDRSAEAVDATVQNGEAFMKFSAITSRIDFELMAGFMWDDDPALHVSKQADPASGQLLAVTVKPEHHRLTIAGGSFSSTVFGFVVRGEGAYYHGKQHPTAAATAIDGLVQRDYVHYLLGLDRTLAGVRLSAQFVQQIIVDYDPAIIADEVRNTVTLLAAANFLRETLHLDLFAYIGLNDADALLRAKIGYDISDGVTATLGADLFVGDSGTFGQYDDNDMLYAKLKYSF